VDNPPVAVENPTPLGKVRSASSALFLIYVGGGSSDRHPYGRVGIAGAESLRLPHTIHTSPVDEFSAASPGLCRLERLVSAALAGRVARQRFFHTFDMPYDDYG